MASANTRFTQNVTSEQLGGLAYSGDVAPAEAFRVLSQEGGVLVDVRSLPEWQFTGTPDLAGTPASLLTVSWKTYPNFTVNPDFAAQLETALGGRKDVPLFFMCKTGGRSLDAAVAMTQLGYARCYNIAGGFEGDQNEQGQRSRKNGWKASNLPWKQG